MPGAPILYGIVTLASFGIKLGAVLVLTLLVYHFGATAGLVGWIVAELAFLAVPIGFVFMILTGRIPLPPA